MKMNMMLDVKRPSLFINLYPFSVSLRCLVCRSYLSTSGHHGQLASLAQLRKQSLYPLTKLWSHVDLQSLPHVAKETL